jgi:sulfatase modifying factor 1
MNKVVFVPFVLGAIVLPFACAIGGGVRADTPESSDCKGDDAGVCHLPGPRVSNSGENVGDPFVDGSSDGACPSDMVLIEGKFCWISPACLYCVSSLGDKVPCGNLGGQGDRCGEFSRDVKCLSKEEHKRFCIDRYEYPNQEGIVPQDWLSYVDAEKIAKKSGKRMCLDSEWSMSAQGPNRHPIPYGDGFHRALRQSVCNMDHTANIDVMKATSPDTETARDLRKLLVPSGSMPDCKSDWGVYDMVANIDEWVTCTRGCEYNSGLMSGHVFGVRNNSFAETTGHYQYFAWYETGARLCKDARTTNGQYPNKE